MIGVVVDSSVLIEEIRRGSLVVKRLHEQSRQGIIRVKIPTVVILEVWAGRSMPEPKLSHEVEIIYKQFEIILLTESIAICAGKLVSSFGLKAMDAAIAATALEENAWLATENRKDFAKIPGLRLWE